MKSISFLFFIICSWTGFGQSSGTGTGSKIGSATLIHKAGDQYSDRWEITFHDLSFQNQLLWLLIKSPTGKLPGPATYRIRKKPFEKMGMSDILAVVSPEGKNLPVKKGSVNLFISDSSLSLDTNLKIKGYGTLKYTYEGRYKVIDAR